MGGAQTNSCGSVLSSGDYTGRVAKTYIITIATNGQMGVAKFNWYGTQPGWGGASNVLATNLVALDRGISIIFTNGTVSPSFRAGDKWHLYVRPDISPPTNTILLTKISGGLLACSVCHDQHSETNTPFDVNAPITAGASGRHFMRINNSDCQLCTECHRERDVTNSVFGSHPVGVTIPSSGFFKTPTNLPLEKTTNKVRCLTCHDIHNSATSDGNLLRIVNRTALCTECHTLANTNLDIHLSASSGVLWPGGQYGTTYPAEPDTTQRGMCNNCHQPHGWPTNLTSTVDYPNLLVDLEEKLCFTCHDGEAGSGAATNNSVIADFTNSTKITRHPVVNSDSLRRAGRSVECTDCHNPHQARVGRSVYTNTATATRNQVVNPNVGASGVAFNYSGLSNFQAPTTNLFTFTNSVAYEYQICFKCHTTYSWGAGTPPLGLSKNGSVLTNETDIAQEFSPNNASGHPIMTGLNSYGTADVDPKPLTTGQMKAPWNVSANMGNQTMLCTDCHNTDGNLAQGPHGSARPFMLRTVFTNGVTTSATNWPNVAMSPTATRNSAWCVNCHTLSAVHTSKHNDTGFYCFNCHIVIPHGGKMSRLIADSDGVMPPRYAYGNVKSNVKISRFKKFTDPTTYAEDNCDASCNAVHDPAGTANEDW